MDKYRSTVKGFETLVDKRREFFVYDTETTGLNVADSDVIEFGCVKAVLNEDGTYTASDSIDIFINPGYPLPEVITDLTGITDEELEANGLSPIIAAAKIHEFLGDDPILVGYNSVSFDTKFMEKLYQKIGEHFPGGKQLDVLVMAKEKTEKPHKLIDMAEKANLTDIRFHRAIDDCVATLGVLNFLLPMYEQEEEKLTGFKVTGVRRWTKSHTLDRVYVSNTNNISVYYDIYRKEWFVGGNISEEEVVKAVFAFAKVEDIETLIKVV